MWDWNRYLTQPNIGIKTTSEAEEHINKDKPRYFRITGNTGERNNFYMNQEFSRNRVSLPKNEQCNGPVMPIILTCSFHFWRATNNNFGAFYTILDHFMTSSLSKMMGNFKILAKALPTSLSQVLADTLQNAQVENRPTRFN